MDLRYSEDELVFRDAVNAFLRDELPVELSDKVRSGAALSKADFKLQHNGEDKDVEIGAVIWVEFHDWQ